MIKLYLHASDVINAIEHTYYANDGLHVNFWKCWLMPFCFMIKKDRFKQRFLLLPQFSFNDRKVPQQENSKIWIRNNNNLWSNLSNEYKLATPLNNFKFKIKLEM